MSPHFPHEAYVGLGSNLDDPARQVHAALAALDRMQSTAVTACSSLYRSAPEGYANQPDFVNAVARLTTALEPNELLRSLLALEQVHGRRRTMVNGPRTLDLDLLLFDALRLAEPGLIVPHPRMHARAFVLVPLIEIAPELEIPGLGRAAQWLDAIGSSGVERMVA